MRLREAPCGGWPSPLSAELVASRTVELDEVPVDGDALSWVETRPEEGDRAVVVQRSLDGRVRDVTPPPYSARTAVHEYGGGSYVVDQGVVVFANFADQRLYRHRPGEVPGPLTPPGNVRYADMVMDAARRRLVCVLEDHSPPGREPENLLAAGPLTGGSPRCLVGGRDFVALPRVSPDSSHLAWVAGTIPPCPGTGPSCGSALSQQTARWWTRPESQAVRPSPSSSPSGIPTAPCTSCRTARGGGTFTGGGEGESSRSARRRPNSGPPQWRFRMSTYALEPSGRRFVCGYRTGGLWRLARVDPSGGRSSRWTSPSPVSGAVRCDGHGAAIAVAGSPVQPPAVVRVDLQTGRWEALRRSGETVADPTFLSRPEAVEFAASAGATAHAFYYPSTNPQAVSFPGERPPLLVRAHGGPTSAARTHLDLEVQYWTTRGFALLDVNYGGSAGYGRAYRERLVGRWGVVDVEDCIAGARVLVERGLADPRRLAIRGASAGEDTTLCAVTFHRVFAAGASYYGVSDLARLRRETHKFESRYLDRLVGPYRS